MKLVVVNLGAHGHINPTLPVVQELVRRGVDVVYFATPDFASAVGATGARFVAYDSLFSRTSAMFAKEAGTAPQEMIARFPLRLMEDAAHVLPQILPTLEAEKPDAVWYDNMVLAARYAVKLLRLPAMLVHPSYVANQYFSLGRQLAAVDDAHPARLQFKAAARAFGRKWAVPELSVQDLFSHSEPLNVVFMPRAFQPAGDTFDERYAFVGPSIAGRPTAGTYAPAGDDGKPVLFISLGTVFNDWPEFFTTCFEAFGTSALKVVMAIGNKVDPRALGPIPANFSVEVHVPQLEVLQHAQAFITHGGMNSTQEALYYGVPLVVIPQMMEQAATARRVEELGLGKAFLERTQVNAGSLRDAVAAITREPRYKENVAKMRAEVRGAGGYQKAADLIQGRLTAVRQ